MDKHSGNVTRLLEQISNLKNRESILKCINFTSIYHCNAKKEDEGTYNFYQKEQLYFLWALFVLIVAGNCTVLGALFSTKNKRSRMNFFIAHLAVADLLVGLTCVLPDIIWRITISFYGGIVVCKFVRFLQITVTYSSTYLLVAVSVDRYDAIRYPMHFSKSPRRSRMLVGLAWLLSGIFAVTPTVLYEYEMITEYPQCWIDMGVQEWRVYIILVACSVFFLPTIIIAACYGVIVFTIWSKSMNNGSNCCHANSWNSHTTSATSTVRLSSAAANRKSKRQEMEVDNEEKRVSSRGVIPRAKIKSVKMTFVIVIVFVLCWCPYFIYGLLQVFDYIPRTPSNNAISSFMQSLAPLNSAANPIIYCSFSTNVLKNFCARIFSPCCKPRRVSRI